jgi:hypothetical protein
LGGDVIIDLSIIKHLLIAGATGSGKSNLFHNIIPTNTNEVADIAYLQQMRGTIASKIVTESLVTSQIQAAWQNLGIDPDTLSYADYQNAFKNAFSISPPLRCALLRNIFAQTRFPESDRFRFVDEAMMYDNNCVVIQQCCTLLDTKRKSNQTFELRDEYDKWYKSAQSTNAFKTKI